jgi:ferritin-like metal-binding protein YciE
LVEETEELMGEAENADVLDAGLIGCAQAVEHYEIARYGTLSAWAEQLKMEEAVTLLEDTLEEEEETDEKLSELALSGINQSAEDDEDNNDNNEDTSRPRASANPRSSTSR